jgi:protein PhnA
VLKEFQNRIKHHNYPAYYEKENIMDVRDSNGTLLSDGDSVTLIKDLKVKGSSITLKRGTMVKGIRLYNETEVECRTDKVKGLRLETQWLKKV